MSFLDQVKGGYEPPKPKNDSWKSRFEPINTWATANPWDQVDKPSEKEIKLCVTELFDIVNTASAAFRYIEKHKDGDKTASYMADILEGI